MDDWCVLGVDLGSTTAKAVVVGSDGRMLSSAVVQMGAVSRKGVEVAIDRALADAGIARDRIVRTISTGYGRKLVPGADRTFTEITCHARGAVALAPGVRLVIDIGGQDSKAIAIGTDGLVDRFAINDRCASGTGRFFDVLSRALEVEVTDVADLALASNRDVEVSGMCATFAETEVISLLAQGEEPSDIAASVHRSVAGRTLGLVAQVGKAAPVVMTGGVAQNHAFVAELARMLGLEVTVLDDPQIAGALGAALIARDDHLGALAEGAHLADSAAEASWDTAKAAPAPHCADCDGHPEFHATGPVHIELALARPGRADR
jgi:predicted CoA-substrate-specific enzyme activase